MPFMPFQKWDHYNNLVCRRLIRSPGRVVTYLKPALIEPVSQSLTLGSVDLRGIEPLPPQCECGVIPLYYRPKGEGRMLCSTTEP